MTVGRNADERDRANSRMQRASSVLAIELTGIGHPRLAEILMRGYTVLSDDDCAPDVVAILRRFAADLDAIADGLAEPSTAKSRNTPDQG